MLNSIIRNLVSNGIDYNKNQGKLILEISIEDEKELVVMVTDTGIGIKESDSKSIFNRFIQLETGVTKSHAGHGLGLSNTKALVELMHGSIHVDGTIGKGCNVRTSLPLGERGDIHTFSDGDNVFFFGDEDENEGEIF